MSGEEMEMITTSTKKVYTNNCDQCIQNQNDIKLLKEQYDELSVSLNQKSISISPKAVSPTASSKIDQTPETIGYLKKAASHDKRGDLLKVCRFVVLFMFVIVYGG
eukprot:239144_1